MKKTVTKDSAPAAKNAATTGTPANASTKAKAPAKSGAKTKKPSKSGTTPKTPAKSGSSAKAPSKSVSSGAKLIKPSNDEKAPVVLLSGGNPQIAKGDGDAPVQAYIAAMPGWTSDLGERLDALIVRNAPKVRKAVKWNSPFYGIEGKGWFVSFHVFARYVKVTFFSGTSLRPPPRGGSEKSKEVRWIDIYEDDELDVKQMAKWVKQAAKLPGWIP